MIRILLIIFLLFVTPIYADTNSNQGQLVIQEQDGTNSGRYRMLIFPNGSTTNNNDGSITITFGTVTNNFLLLEDASFILLEDGTKMIL